MKRLQKEVVMVEATEDVAPQEKRLQKEVVMEVATEETVEVTSANITSVCRLKRCIVGEVKRDDETFWLKRSSACEHGVNRV